MKSIECFQKHNQHQQQFFNLTNNKTEMALLLLIQGGPIRLPKVAEINEF